MKRITALLSSVIFALCVRPAAAEPKAEILRETPHRPVAGNLDQLPVNEKMGDYFRIRSVSDDSITVQYGLQNPAEPGIAVRLLCGEETAAEITAPGRFGRILFSGLAPDTDYTAIASYQTPPADENPKINGLSGEEALASLSQTCRTLPSERGELLVKAAFVSDTHVSVIAKVQPRLHCISAETLADVCRDAAARGCTLMINGGDVTNAARGEEFAMAEEAMKEFPGKILLVPGNHDIVEDKELVKWRAAFGSEAGCEVIDGVQFLRLDTADGRLGKEKNFEAIDRFDPGLPTVIFTHYQLVGDEDLNDKNKAVSDAGRCAPQLEKIASSNSVIYVGHKNVAALAHLGNVPQINMPQTTQFPMGWLEAEIRSDGIYQRFVFSTGADREELSRVLGGCYIGTIGYRDRRSAEIWNAFIPWPKTGRP